MPTRWINVRAEVEIMIPFEHGTPTAEEFKEAMESAVKNGYWFHISHVQIVHEAQEE